MARVTADARKYQRSAFMKEITSTYTASLVDIKNDTVHLLRLGYNLRPNVVDIADEEGNSKTVMNVSGSIPSFVNGQEYYIPITIWITNNYPKSAPPTYVSPLPGTMLDPELRCVAEDGLVRIKYNMAWSEKSNLVQYVRELAAAFSDTPPVYSASPRVAKQRVPEQRAQIPTIDMLTNPSVKPVLRELESGMGSPHLGSPRLVSPRPGAEGLTSPSTRAVPTLVSPAVGPRDSVLHSTSPRRMMSPPELSATPKEA